MQNAGSKRSSFRYAYESFIVTTVQGSFDPLSAEFARDPYPAYAELRGTDGLPWFAAHSMYLVSRFDEVTALVKDRAMTRTLDAFRTPAQIADQKREDNWHDMPFHSRFVQCSMLDSDGDVHDRLRKQVFQFFGPAPVARLRDSLEPHIHRLIDEALGAGKFDFVEDLAAHIPGYTIGMLMGVPIKDCAQIRRWSEQIVQYFDVDRTDAKKQLAEETTETFYKYLQGLVKHRKQAPQDDLISKLIEVESAGMISHDEFYSTCMLIVMAGHGSTLDVMSTGMRSLLVFPEQMDRLRESSALMKTAIQEMFRFESPLPFFHRYATADVVIDGVDFAAGTRFGLLYGAANRDDRAFAEPDKFDVGRWPNRHLAFGGGAHFCLGNHLARLSMDLLFSALLEKTRTIELLDQAPRYKSGLGVRGLQSLRIRAEMR